MLNYFLHSNLEHAPIPQNRKDYLNSVELQLAKNVTAESPILLITLMTPQQAVKTESSLLFHLEWGLGWKLTWEIKLELVKSKHAWIKAKSQKAVKWDLLGHIKHYHFRQDEHNAIQRKSLWKSFSAKSVPKLTTSIVFRMFSDLMTLQYTYIYTDNYSNYSN